MYRIGDFSKLTKTSIKALRYYEDVGLLKPEFKDPVNMYRFYSSKQLIKLHQIHAYRQAGLSIEEIKKIFNGHNSLDILEQRKTMLCNEMSHINSQISQIEFILSGKEEESIMKYSVIVKQTPECIVYYKEMNITSYDDYFTEIPKIGEEVTKANPDLKCLIPEYCFIRYLDGEYKEKDFRIEYCEAVEKMGNETETIKFKKIDSVTAACVLHKGPYSDLRKAYAFIMDWVEKNDYKISESPRESYIDGIWNKEDPKEWLTEIQIPIVKK